jgi:hypothetical protein
VRKWLIASTILASAVTAHAQTTNENTGPQVTGTTSVTGATIQPSATDPNTDTLTLTTQRPPTTPGGQPTTEIITVTGLPRPNTAPVPPADLNPATSPITSVAPTSGPGQVPTSEAAPPTATTTQPKQGAGTKTQTGTKPSTTIAQTTHTGQSTPPTAQTTHPAGQNKQTTSSTTESGTPTQPKQGTGTGTKPTTITAQATQPPTGTTGSNTPAQPKQTTPGSTTQPTTNPNTAPVPPADLNPAAPPTTKPATAPTTEATTSPIIHPTTQTTAGSNTQPPPNQNTGTLTLTTQRPPTTSGGQPTTETIVVKGLPEPNTPTTSPMALAPVVTTTPATAGANTPTTTQKSTGSSGGSAPSTTGGDTSTSPTAGVSTEAPTQTAEPSDPADATTETAEPSAPADATTKTAEPSTPPTTTPKTAEASAPPATNGKLSVTDSTGAQWTATLSGPGLDQPWTSAPTDTAQSGTAPAGTAPSGTTAALTPPGQTTPVQTPCPSGAGGGTGAFTVQNGQIIGPDGKPFIARGINIMHGNDPSASAVQNLFAGVNFIRLAIYNFDDPNSLASEVNDFTSKGIVVELENHLDSNGANNGGGQGSVYSGAQLATEQAWYASVGKAFASNPYVWFGTKNEPPSSDQAALSKWEGQTYDTIRGAGNNNPVMLESACDPTNLCNSGFTKSIFASMKNVIWDKHFYNWLTNSADVNTNIAMIDKMAASLQPFTSADGVMPIIIGEYGNSTDGQTIDAGGDASVQAVINEGGAGKIGSAAWAWGPGNPGDGLTTDSSGGARSNPYGDEVALYINSSTVAPNACQINNTAAKTVANAMNAANQPAGTTTPAGTTASVSTTPADTTPAAGTTPATDTATTNATPNPAVNTATQSAQTDTAAADAIVSQAMAGQQPAPVQ